MASNTLSRIPFCNMRSTRTRNTQAQLNPDESKGGSTSVKGSSFPVAQAQVTQVPVPLHGRHLRVMRESRAVFRSAQGVGHRVAEEDGEDSVSADVAGCFVECWRMRCWLGGIVLRCGMGWDGVGWGDVGAVCGDGRAMRRGKDKGVLLSRTRVRFMKLGLLRRGTMKERSHCPATVTEESCPSFASN